MSFWNSLFGTTSGSTAETTLAQTQNVNQTQKTQSQQRSTQTTQTLDPQTISLLHGIVQQLGGNVNASPDADTIRNLVGQLGGNMTNDQINARVASSEAEARRQYQLGEGANISQVQQQIGSKGNSYSQLLDRAGNTDLAVALENAGNNARFQGAQQQTADLVAAIQGTGEASNVQSAPLQRFLSAVGSLTGTQTTQTGTTDLTSLITSMMQAITNQETHGKNSGVNMAPIMSMFGSSSPTG